MERFPKRAFGVMVHGYREHRVEKRLAWSNPALDLAERHVFKRDSLRDLALNVR